MLRSCRLIHLVGTAGDIFFNPSTGNDRCSGRPGGLGLAAFYFERHPAAAIGGVLLRPVPKSSGGESCTPFAHALASQAQGRS